jgi:hypothetical protein
MDRACSLHGLVEEVGFGGGNGDEDHAFKMLMENHKERDH